MPLYRLSMPLYFIGTAIVAASWANLVSNEIGWTGWLVGMTGWALSHTARPAAPAQYPAPTSVADELLKLERLRDEGILSPAEYDAQRVRLLGGD